MMMKTLVLLCVIAMASVSAAPPLTKEAVQVRYVGLVVPSGVTTGRLTNVPSSLVAGQDARLRITMSTLRPSRWSTILFNASAGSARVRIIPAYTSRGSSGTRLKCNTHGSDYWQEFWGMSSSRYVFGHNLVTQGFVTFTVPPFPWRACIQTTAVYRNTTYRNATNPSVTYGFWRPRRVIKDRFIVVNTSSFNGDNDNGVWSELSNMDTTIQTVNASARYFWTSSSNMYAGDNGYIKIMQNGYQHDSFISLPTLLTEDVVKLVPAGFPCTYEKSYQKDYCGSNRFSLRGRMFDSCAKEGSIQHGIPIMGSNQYNPYGQAAITTARQLTFDLMKGGENLVAYFELPAAGNYDVCFSPRARRQTSLIVQNSSAPVFYKIFKSDTNCASASVTSQQIKCNPTTRLVIAAKADALRWSTPHIYPGTWGAIRVYHPSGTTILNTNPAILWDLSSTREYFTTTGGDHLRLVPTSAWTTTAITYGRLYKDSNGNTYKTVGLQRRSLATTTSRNRYAEYSRISSTGSSYSTFGASGDSLLQTQIETPDQGSSLTLTSSGGGGCWNWFYTNYGNYGKGLNGASTITSTYCCTLSNNYCASFGTSCSLSDTDNDGVTSSADLGTDPRANLFAWTHNSAAASEAWAYIRFPVSGRWNVCYRQGGTENWRIITAATGSVNYFDALNYKRLNYTYHVNDSQSTTWGPLYVRDPQKTLTTLNLNYFGSSDTVVGSAVKLVLNTASCYTDAGATETYDPKPGLPECEVGFCSGSATCAGCTGQSDDTTTARWEIVFYVRMPTYQTSASTYYRVCFKNGAQNWMQLQDPKYIKHTYMTSPWKFNSRPVPQLDFSLQDWREGTWGKVLLRRLANPNTQAFNIDPNNRFGSGDVVRFVQNRTDRGVSAHCDITWGATSGEFLLQNFNPVMASWNLGVYCLSVSTTTTTSRCYTTKVNPTDSVVSEYAGMYPYANLDSTADGSYLSDPAVDGAVAFITIPPKLTATNAGYRMCYKPQASNWIEIPKLWSGAPNPFVVITKPTYTASVTGTVTSTIYAGQYGYITIAGGSIDLDADLVKLVLDSSGGCDRPAAGTLSPGNSYVSFSWRKKTSGSWTEAGRGGQAFVKSASPSAASATLGSRSTTTSARAYITFPTVAGLTAVTTTYKICYMSRPNTAGDIDTMNWHNLGSVGVYSPGVAFTAENQPYNGAVLGVRLVTGGTLNFNTLPGGDSAKIVALTAPCYGLELASADRPNGILSRHVGQEFSATELGLSSDNTTLLENGNDDLGDSNLASTSTARFETTLPWATSRTYYKVCYKPRGLPWIELNQAPLAQQVYALGTDNLYTFDAALSTYTIASNIIGVTPFTGAVYATGISYTSTLVGGAATASVSTSNTSYFYVSFQTGTDWANYATDTFKLILYSDEVVRGTYSNIPRINCRSPGVLSVNPGVGSVASGPTKPAFAANLPTRGGRYLLCYRKTGLDAWIKLEPDSTASSAGLTNPFRVIPNSLSFAYTKSTGNFTVTDLFSTQYNSKETAMGSVNSNDKIYIVNSTDACGLAHGFAWDPKAPTATTSLSNNIDNAPKALIGTSNVSQQTGLTLPTNAGWYKLCYRRTATKTMATASTDTTPQPYTPVNWYQINNAGELTDGGNTPFFVTAKASKLRIEGCPRYNASRPLRTGQPVDITVSVLDTQNNVLPFSIGTWSYLVTAVADANGFALSNIAGTCRAAFAPQYGWDAFNLRQWTSQGQVTFSLAILSGCPTGGCAITFSASDNIKAPGGTNALLEPTKCTLSVRTTSVSSMSVWEGVSTCRLDDTCPVRIAAFWTDGGLAHTATDDVQMSASGISGLTLKVNGIAVTDTTSVKVGSLASGYFLALAQFDVSSGSLFTANSAVTLKFAAGGKNASFVMTVIRPVATKLYVVDFYPEDVQVTNLADSDKFVRPFLVPTWEPTDAYFTGIVSAPSTTATGKSALVAGSGYHMVAMQVYTAVLRPVDAEGRFIDKVALLDPTKPTITITNTDSTFTGNRILRSCDTDEVCDTAFTGVQMSATKQKISFRLKNSIGCTTTSPCTLSFKMDGNDIGTSITTPVRSLATNLRVTCWLNTATTEAALGSGSVGSCPSTTVEKGWAVKIEAIDANSRVDEYFEGNVLPLLVGGTGLTTDRGINITTVSRLAASTTSATVGPTAFVKGVAWIFGLTYTKPCLSGCNLQMVTDWGAAIANLGPAVVTPSTVKLACTLDTQLYACVVNSDGNCESISGYFSYDTSVADNNKVSLIYKDTTVCATVTAVNADGTRTLYETNWVMYWAQALAVSGTTVNAVSIADAGNSPTRVKAMARSGVQFCFKVSSASTKANFRIRFAAQRFNDANYWSKGTNGECNLGTFTYWGKKHVANLALTKVTDPITALTTLPATSASLFAQRADAEKTVLGTTLSFGILDHYGNSIAPADVDSTQTANQVVISACSLDDTGKKLASSCTASSVDSTSNIAMSAPSAANQKEGGVLKVTLGTTVAIAITGDTITYPVTLDRWCLGCYLTFKVKTATGDYKTKFPGTTDNIPTARVTWFVVIHSAIENRLLAFRVDSSPWNYWQKWDTSSSSPSATKGSVVLFKDTCFTSDKATCSPVETWFQPTICDEQTVGTAHRIAGSLSGSAIQAYVVSATSTTGALTSSTIEPTCNNGDCSTITNVIGQVDILNSYTISLDIGTQVLQCSGTACTDDMTVKPKQAITALGATAIDAARKFATGLAFSSTSFVVSGVYPSNYYSQSSSKLVKTETPSYASKLTITAESNATGVKLPDAMTTGSYNFVFKGPKIAERFAVKATAVESKCPVKPTYACVGSATDCTYTGYQRSASLDSIAYKYAYSAGDSGSIVPIGTQVPITVQVEDGNSVRVATAKGTVSVELYSWSGCNNGGTMTVVGGVNNKDLSLDSGRVTAWISFSDPCERCVLRFTLTPDSTQSDLYATLNVNKAQLIQFSQPIDVRDNLARTATYLVATNSPSDQKSTLTISDKVTVNMIPVRAIGATAANLQVMDKFATGEAYAYNQVQTSGRNWAWFGNGGVLRKDETATIREHHTVGTAFTSTGAVALTFAFSRTCPNGCSVRIAYHVNGNVNSFLVQNAQGTSFTVTATSTKYVLVGYRPRMVQQDTDFALSVWHAGEGQGVTFAGIGSSTMSPAKAAKNVEDSVNGDGGDIIDQAYTIDRTEIHRVRVPRTTNRVRIGIGSDSARMNVYTKATYLRVDRPDGAKQLYNYPMTSEFASFGVYAVDDLGFVDVRVGGYSGCFAYDPLQCPSSPSQDLTCTLSANGLSDGGFTPSDDTFLAAKVTDGTMDAVFKKLTDGIGKDIRVQFPRPVRNAYPIFKAGASLTSAGNSIRRPLDSNIIDVSVGKTGLNIVTKRSATDTISMFSALTIEVGLVKLVADDTATSPTSYIAVEADNAVRATFDASCPAVTASSVTQGSLKKGYTQLSVAFSAPTTGSTKCTVTVEALSGSGVCSTPAACKTTFQLTVTTITVYKWAWVSPSALDNGGVLGNGAYFGATSRTTVFRVAVFGKLTATTDTVMTTCDDPSTSNKEVCKLTVTADATCTNRPTISSDSWNETTGEGSISVTWADASASYTCLLAVSVVDGNNKALSVDGTPAGAPVVTVCKPANIVMLTNTTSAFAGQFLRTGIPYSFSYAVVDSKGVHCRGDSGDSASEFAADLVTADRSARAITTMGVYNTNLTTTARGWVPPTPMTAKAVGGIVTFGLVFTNSSINLGTGSFRVRVQPTKGLTSTSSSTIQALSGALDTVVAASTLRFDPRANLPRDWVMNRVLPRVVVAAVDGVDPRVVPTGPNVARRPTEVGNAEKIAWRVNPLPATGFPLTFSTGQKETALVGGTAEFVATFSTSRDGAYDLVVGSTDPQSLVQPTPPATVNFQTINSVQVASLGFTPSSPAVCNTDCLLPNSTFTAASVNGTNFLNSTMLRPFNVSVLIADAAGRAVIGENVSFVQVRMVKQVASSTAAVTLTIPESGYTARETAYFAPVIRGAARFSLGFVGSTVDGNTNQHSHVTLEFSCPKLIPARIAGTRADIPNPCAANIQRDTALTMPIRVIDPSVPRTTFSSATVLAAKPVFRIPTTATSVALFNASDFKLELSKRIQAKFPYINPSNAESVILVTACEVVRSVFSNADLGSSVCTASGKCSGSNTECPTGVNKCLCPNSKKALSALLGRYLLQSSSDVQVQVEASFELANAVGFSATSESAIVAAYAALGTETVNILKTDSTLAASFKIDSTNVGSKAASSPPVTSAPTPVPATPAPPTPPSTPAPVVTVAPTAEPSSASGLGMSLTALLAMLLLLALMW
eukprot:PhF_6_TR15995/c0_g1_i1/m.25119